MAAAGAGEDRQKLSVEQFSFRVANYGALRRMNLVGEQVVVVLIDDASLGLFGEKDGTVRLMPIDIERIRVGVIEGKRRVFFTKIWPADGRKPFELIPPRWEWGAYSRVMSHYVTMLANDHKGDRVSVGASKFDAILAPFLFGLLAAGAILVSVFVLDNEPWWGRLLVPLLPVTLFAVFLGMSITRTWPRAMRSLDQLTKQLPPSPRQ
jgi:hypothetical protein